MLRRRRQIGKLFAAIILGVTMYVVRNIITLNFPAVSTRVKSGSRSLRQRIALNRQFDRQQDQACVHPNLPLWSKDIKADDGDIQPIKCTDDTDWVYTADGKFYISAAASLKHGQILCGYIPLVNKEDDVASLKPVAPMMNGSALQSDAFKVSCKATDGYKYVNVHACISRASQDKETNSEKRNKSAIVQHGMNVNVLMLGFDSVSRQTWKRCLPKTHAYFTETLGGSVLEGYNIVGDGTPQALMPILTGKSETEIPEVRRGKAGAKRVDEAVTFVWKRFEERGYTTQWGEDMANIGTFNYRMLGFKHKPARHYMRPFYLKAIPMYPLFPPLCQGSKTRQHVFFDWIKEGLHTNKGQPFFTFGFFSEYSHRNQNDLPLADSDMTIFLDFLLKDGFLENTVLILMSDHGARIGQARTTEQGKLEERMPYFGFLFPTWFKTKYRQEMENFARNTKRLVTPFDIHETLMDILEHAAPPEVANISDRGISLFKKIPTERTCEHAHIEPHWCACSQWDNVPLPDPDVQSAVNAVINLINNMTSTFSTLCSKLLLHSITKAMVYTTNDKMLRFKKSIDEDGREPDLTDKLKAKERLFQVTFVATPGLGLFEATVRLVVSTNTFIANEYSISRLNIYGDAPACIISTAPRLRPYCVCKG